MVVKLSTASAGVFDPFERCVILNGSKTLSIIYSMNLWFERCVILNGSKTYRR